MNDAAEVVEVEEKEETQEKEPKLRKKATGISKDAAITVVAVANPKRAGSAAYDRFEGYLSDPAPATVQEALDAGLTMGDISYDFIHGSITVDGAEIVEYTPKKRAPKSDDGEEGSDEVVTEDETESEEAF